MLSSSLRPWARERGIIDAAEVCIPSSLVLRRRGTCRSRESNCPVFASRDRNPRVSLQHRFKNCRELPVLSIELPPAPRRLDHTHVEGGHRRTCTHTRRYIGDELEITICSRQRCRRDGDIDDLRL